MSINADPTKFDLSAGSGTFIDYTVATVPTFKSISWNAFLAQTVTGLATQDETYILINNLGAIIQQSNYPTPNQRRVNIFIGRIGHTSRTTIQFATSFPDFSQSISSSTFDLFDALGPFNISGNEVLNNGANLTFQRTAGRMFFRSFNYPLDTYNPHTVTTTAIVPALFNYRLRTGGPALPAVTAVDPGFYDVAGVRTVIPGGPNVATIQRVYLAPNGVMQVQYGQTVYPNISTAAASIGTDPFIQNPALTNVTILIAYIVVRAGALALNNPGDASILRAPKFETGVGGGVNTVTSLQQAYNSSVQPQIVLNSTGLGLQIRDNSAPIGTTLFQVANNAGTSEYLRVTAASVFSINVLNISNVSASTSPTTGSITTTGGLGVSLDVNVGGTVTSGQIIDNGLTANTAVVANASKQLTSSTTTSTQLGFLSNVTSDIQTQINTKQGTNLILDPLFESGTVSQWSKGTIGAITNGLPTGTPTFGSGSSANLTISAVTSGQIQGTTSLSYASSATNVQGDMMATGAIPIDPEYRTKVLGIKFAYQLIAGTADFSGTSTNSWAWALYDVTNANFIGTAGQFNLVQSSGVGICTGTVQIPSNTASVRFIIYNVKATTGATTIYFDDFYLGPQVSMQAPAMDDLRSYPLTSAGIQGFGTATNISAFSKRIGDNLEFRILFQAGTVTATEARVTLGYNGGVGNVVIDTSKMATNAPLGEAIQGSVGNTIVYPIAQGGSNNFINFGVQSSTNSALAPAFATLVTGSTAFVVIHGFVPIVGWSSNSVSSADTDTRVVALRATGTALQPLTGSNTLNTVVYTSAVSDTHGSYNTTTGIYTIPVSGYYDITASVLLSTISLVAGQEIDFSIYVNNSPVNISAQFAQATATVNYLATVSGNAIFLKAGDLLKIVENHANAATFTTFNNPTTNYLNVSRLSGPAVITATESVSMSYFNTAGTTVNTSPTDIPFASKYWDSHSAFGGTSYVVPISGKYRMSASILFGANMPATNASQILAVQAGSASVTKYGNLLPGTGVASNFGIVFTGTFNCLAGDTLKIQASAGVSGPLNTTAGANHISIERVGN